MTLTSYEQLKAYWWDATKRTNKVKLQVRYTKPINSALTQSNILMRLAVAKDKLLNPHHYQPVFSVKQAGANDYIITDDVPRMLMKQAS